MIVLHPGDLDRKFLHHFVDGRVQVSIHYFGVIKVTLGRSFQDQMVGLPVIHCHQFDPTVDIFIINGIFNRDLPCRLLVW